MKNRQLVLNIAVNLGRLGRWAAEGKTARIEPFIAETEQYIKQLELIHPSARFEPTWYKFRDQFDQLKASGQRDAVWAEMMLTWANILTHRADFA
jgi:hypothetical protein